MTDIPDENYTTTAYNAAKIETFERDPEWRCELFGTGAFGIVLHPQKGGVPNAFWRWMQFVCFGNKWIRTKK